MGQYDQEYPDAICMECGKVCKTNEVVHVWGDVWELWCYCKLCNVETFHPGKPLEESP